VWHNRITLEPRKDAMGRESKADRKSRTAKIISRLRKAHPDARCALNHSNPLELLVATILSAQCTDERVNQVTPQLFAQYPTAAAYAQVGQETLETQIRSTGFFRNKAKNIREAARRIAEDHGGRVPETMDELLALPGVARKTANVVLGVGFGRNEGIVVDTHVTRLAGRLGLTGHPNNQGDRIEKDLLELVPRKSRTEFGHLMIFHGRRVCTARKPDCQACTVSDLCPSAFKF
jgi:endonuclease-3